MTKTERARIARQLAAILQCRGASVSITEDTKRREVGVHAVFPDVVEFSCDVHEHYCLASWYNANGRLNPHIFPHTNTVHGHKATCCTETWPGMLVQVGISCAGIARGEAFIATDIPIPAL